MNARRVIIVLALLGAGVLLWYGYGRDRGVRLSCDSHGDLAGFVHCVVSAAPRPDTTGRGHIDVATPAPADLVEIARLTRQLLDESAAGRLGCNAVLPRALRAYSLDWIADGERRYCALWEPWADARAERVSKGWGTLLVAERSERELALAAPHPLADQDTERQALMLFRMLGARAVLIAGMHRRASAAPSTCVAAKRAAGGGGYPASDPTHNVGVYSALATGVALHYGARLDDTGALDLSQAKSGWAFVELHGMAYGRGAGSCVDAHGAPLNVFVTHGGASALAADTPAARLVAALSVAHPDWQVASPGAGARCDKLGRKNVVGRIYRGIPNTNVNAAGNPVCNPEMESRARAPSPHFVHIEQTPCVDGDDHCLPGDGRTIRDAGAWADAFDAAFPSPSGP